MRLSHKLCIIIIACLGLLPLNQTGNSQRLLNSTHTTNRYHVDSRSDTDEATELLTRLYEASSEQLCVNWRWKYIDEQTKNSTLEKPEESVDVRLSNIVSLTVSTTLANTDIYEFDLDPELDKQLELTAAQIDGVDDELCGQQLIRMLSLMEELQEIAQERRLNSSSTRRTEERHLRLASVLDSNGKYGPGMMAGRALFLGAHTQCVDSQLVLGDDASLTDMRYCVAKLRADKHLDPALRAMPKEPYQPDTVLSVAICVPKSCHTKSFRKHRDLFKRLVDSQFKLPTSVYIDEHLELDSVFCLLDDSPLARIPPSGYLLIAVLAAWFSLLIYATFFRNQQDGHSPWKQHILNALDLRLSWSDFTCGNSPQASSSSRVNLGTLTAFKVLGCIFVVFVHGISFRLSPSLNPLKAYRAAELDPVIMTSFNMNAVVDSFFVITGIEIGRKAISTVGSLNNGDSRLIWFMRGCYRIAFDRYLRLVPLYFIIFWFKKSVFNYIGSGSEWDFGYNRKTVVGACKLDSWFTPFTAYASYKSMSEQCLPQSWSIATDIFSCVFLAPILVLMTRKPQLGFLIGVLICLASNFSIFFGLSSLDPALVDGLRKFRIPAMGKLIKHSSEVYSSAHSRMFAVVVGLLTGFTLHYYENKAIQKWPNWFKGFMTKISMITVLMVPLTPAILLPHIRAMSTNTDAVSYIALLSLVISRLGFSVANAVLLLRMVTDWKDSCILKNNTDRLWSIMVKLNYPILLIHFDVLLYDLMQMDSSKYYSSYNIFNLFYSAYFTCLIIAIILHIFIENPLDKLVRASLKRSNGQKAAELKVD